MKRLHAVVSGRVQGVSFRHHTTMRAKEIGVKGWVYNRKDGTVEVVAEGTEAQLKQLEEFLHDGSPNARVESVNSTRQEATGEFHTFRIAYDYDFLA